MCVQNGDKVVYSKYAGTELKVQGGDFVLLKVRRPSFITAAQFLHNLPLNAWHSIPRTTLQDAMSNIHHNWLANGQIILQLCTNKSTLYCVFGNYRKKMSLEYLTPLILHNCYPLETEY